MKRSHSAESNLCRFSFSDGRRCRMLVHFSPRGLCPFHAREEMQIIESRRLGSELSASLTGHFHTAADVNHILGKVFTALAQNRIPARNAAILAYIGQLLLHSIPAVKAETQFKYTYDSWSRMIDRAVPVSDPPDLDAKPAPANPPTSNARASHPEACAQATDSESAASSTSTLDAGCSRAVRASQDFPQPEERKSSSRESETSEFEEPQPV
jgi:hypothetical protein